MTGKHNIITTENGVSMSRIVVVPEQYKQSVPMTIGQNSFLQSDLPLSSSVRWSCTEPAAVGEKCAVSGNGKYSVVGWMLNNHRISFHDNSGSVPVWEYITGQGNYINYVAISDTGGVIALGSNLNVLMFTNTSNTPFFSFDLTKLSDTGIATSLDISKNGQFLVASVSRNDSSTIFGFNSTSTTPFWKKRLQPTITTGGGSVQGVKMSGNDSLVIVNTYAEFYVMNTYTGQIIYSGLINPSSPSSGTQSPQGISGDGSVIATINYSGIVRVYQRSGSTYNFLWQNQEPPGQFFNWSTSVDINYNGEYVAAGTLNFITSSLYDGKVKVFKRSGSGTPQWTFAGCGDEVNALSFSSNGNILTAASWGEFGGTTQDLYVFKTFLGSTPIFRVDTPGSFFSCGTSNDGRTVVASGKAVHARQFGSGGLMYNIDVDTSEVPTSINNHSSGTVEGFSLHQNYPNPFNPVTKIVYEIPSSSDINSGMSLKVYDVLGSEVANLLSDNSAYYQSPGRHEIIFDGSALSSGVYFYELRFGEYHNTRKLVLMK
jgi:hypothetical protein